MPEFKGIIAALISAFDEKGEVYEAGMENEIGYMDEKGIHTIFACGSYGAFPVMTIEQRERMAKTVIKAAKKRNMKVIIQIGSTSTADAVRMARRAEEDGADAVSAVVPYYYSTTIYNEAVFLAYYEEIIRAVSIPVHCYNNPNTTGFNVSPAFLGKLIDAGLRGIKDGGSDMGRMLDMLNTVGKKGVNFDYYPSSTSSLITGFLLGAASCISGVALTAPELVAEIYSCVQRHEIDKAVELYRRVMSIRSILGKKCGRAIAAYDVFHAKGIDVGTCKPPWQRMNKEDSAWLISELKKEGMLK